MQKHINRNWVFEGSDNFVIKVQKIKSHSIFISSSIKLTLRPQKESGQIQIIQDVSNIPSRTSSKLDFLVSIANSKRLRFILKSTSKWNFTGIFSLKWQMHTCNSSLLSFSQLHGILNSICRDFFLYNSSEICAMQSLKGKKINCSRARQIKGCNFVV